MRCPASLFALLALGACQPPAPAPPPRAREATPTPGVTRTPAIRGGSLLVTTDARRAVVSDPDRDVLVVLDLERGLRPLGHVALPAGSGPGRLAEDDDGRVHAVLRDRGEIASVDPETAEPLGRRSVCPAPRGIAFDPNRGALLVACAGGAVKALTDERHVLVAELGEDLRDVVVDMSGVPHVTRFRRPALIDLAHGDATAIPSVRLAANGGRLHPDEATASFAARVAWRAAASWDGSVWIAHQRHLSREVREPFFHYYGGRQNPSVVQPAITRIKDGRVQVSRALPDRTLAVDMAISPGGDELALAYAATRAAVEIFDADTGEARRSITFPGGAPVALGWIGETLLVQQRHPSGFTLLDTVRGAPITHLGYDDAVGLEAEPQTGARLFHGTTPTHVACASCHPEAGDDGHVWNFAGERRRTPSLRGGIGETAPFHWTGEHEDLRHLMDSVFRLRMAGRAFESDELVGLGEFLDEQEAQQIGEPPDPRTARRGQTLFNDPGVGCAGCHSGPLTTDNLNHDVGTGGFFQTPPLLGLRDRLPLFHDGRAASIAERFGAHHTAGHGDLEGLDAGDLRDLISYLETL